MRDDSSGRWVSGTQPAVDLDQRVGLGLDRVLGQRVDERLPDLLARREDRLEPRHTAGRDLGQRVLVQRLRRLDQHLAGRRVDDVGHRARAVHFARGHGDPLDARVAQLVDLLRPDAAALLDHLVALGVGHRGARSPVYQAGADAELVFPVVHSDLGRGVERAQDRRVVLQAERAQERRDGELALAIDAHVQQVLLVRLELDPRPAVRNDLGHVRGLGRVGLEEHARAAVQLAHDHALGSVDDERAVVGEHRDLPEVDLLLLDVADALGLGLGILVVDHELDRDLQRHGVRLAPLLALLDVVLELQRHGIAAVVALTDGDRRQVAAVPAVGLATLGAGGDRADDRRIGTRCADARSPAAPALALPVPDRVLDELERAGLAEVLDREDRLEHALQTGLRLAVGGRGVHLQEPLVRALLHLDQVRDRNRARDAREVGSRPGAVGLGHRSRHSWAAPRRTRREAEIRRTWPGSSGPARTGRTDRHAT